MHASSGLEIFCEGFPAHGVAQLVFYPPSSVTSQLFLLLFSAPARCQCLCTTTYVQYNGEPQACARLNYLAKLSLPGVPSSSKKLSQTYSVFPYPSLPGLAAGIWAVAGGADELEDLPGLLLRRTTNTYSPLQSCHK